MEKLCPIIGKACLREGCEFWVSIQMVKLETQEHYFEHKCVVNAIAPMLIELVKKTGGVQAAIEDQRNKMDLGNKNLISMISAASRKSLAKNEREDV